MKTPFLIAASLTAGLLTAAPSATTELPPAPTGVRIEWADNTRERIRVTWTDTGTENRVSVKTLSGNNDEDRELAVVSPTAPNQLLLNKYALPWNREAVQLVVSAVNSAGASANHSVRFDTTYAPEARITQALPQTDGRVRLSWIRAAMPIDRNPGDPLDVPFNPDLLTPVVVGDKTYPVPAGTRSFVLPSRPAGYTVAILSRNEWGESPNADNNQVQVGRMMPKLLSVPKSTTFGSDVKVDLLTEFGYCPAGQACNGGETTWQQNSTDVVTQLQARDNAGAPWQLVKQSDTRWMHISATAVGTRQYRVVFPTWARKYPTMVTPWIATQPFTVTTSYVASTYDFNNGNIVPLGRSATSTVQVQPAVNLRVPLQRWTGSTWAHVKYVQLSKGAGSATVTATKRGNFLYRYVIPNSTWSGRLITSRTAAAYLTVR